MLGFDAESGSISTRAKRAEVAGAPFEIRVRERSRILPRQVRTPRRDRAPRLPMRGRAASARAASAVMIACGAFLCVCAPHTTHPVLISAAGFIPLFILARIGRVRVGVIGGALWGLSLVVCSGLLFSGGVSISASSSMLGYVFAVAVPAVFSGAAAYVTRRFGYSPFILAVAWYAIECLCATFGSTFASYEMMVGAGAWYHPVASALGYTIVALIVSWSSASIVLALDAVVHYAGVAARRISSATRDALLLPPLDEHRSLLVAFLSLCPRAPPICHCIARP